jgi:hypothetical protein
MNIINEYDYNLIGLIIIVIISIIYIIILVVYIRMSNKSKSGNAEISVTDKSKISNEIEQIIETSAQTGYPDLSKIPYQDEYQTILESSIDSSLGDYKINKDTFADMKKYLETNIRYKRRCLLVSIKNNKISFTTPNPKANIWERDGVDNRVFTFVKMIKDLDNWCTNNKCILPECEFVIYAADTFAWEEVAKDLPWFIMAKPINRPGILIPDNSFISHGISGDIGLNNMKSGKATKESARYNDWMWDKLVKKSKSLSFDKTKKEVYFKGANTGMYKFATRDYLSKYKWDIPIIIDLSSMHEPMFEWSKYPGLLNLPGHQPWSYRLKYLYLLKSPVINVDVLLRYTDPLSDEKESGLERWVQFFDPLFIPNEDYIQVSQIYYDNPKLQNFGELRKESYDKLVADINSSYKTIQSENTYAENAYKKITKLTTSRILQFLYVTISKYAILSNSDK